MKKIIPIDYLQGEISLESSCILEGENGVGKSTLVRFLKKELFGSKYFDIGYLDQNKLSVSHSYLASDYLELICELRNKKISKKLIRSFFFEEKIKRPISDLSGGENQVLKIIGLILGGYSFWVLDEPFQHLDTKNREIFIEKINDFLIYGEILIIDHQAEFASKISNKYFLKFEGKKRVLRKVYGI